MYGYFDFKKAYLRNNERAVFTCYYCRLCYCLWNKGGQKARYLTTYDATLYNLILTLAGVDTRPPYLSCERVKTNNKKRFRDDIMGNLIADLAIIGFAVKVKDDETDGEGKRAFVANLFFKKLIKRTSEKYRDLYDKSYASILALDELQRNHAPIEDALRLYGQTMEDSFHYFFDLEERYLRAINMLARWSFLIDMIDDYNDDVKKKAVNSLFREDSPTVDVLFKKHYCELVPIVRNVMEELKRAVRDIACEETEWIILNKIIGHSLATLIPDILDGKDVRYHYFRDMISSWKKRQDNRKTRKKYEKDTVYHQSNQRL